MRQRQAALAHDDPRAQFGAYIHLALDLFEVQAHNPTTGELTVVNYSTEQRHHLTPLQAAASILVRPAAVLDLTDLPEPLTPKEPA